MNTATAPAPTTIVIASPSDDLQERVTTAVDVASSYRGAVTCPEMREALAGDLKAVKALQKVVEDERTLITKPINEGLRNTNAFFKRFSEPLEQAERILKAEALTWDREQERQLQLARAAAARKADEERARLAAEAATQQAAGNVETAHAISQAAQMVAPVPVAVERPKIAGESTREVWHAEVDDLIALARAVADGVVSPECIEANMPVLNQLARAQKATMKIPGVRAVSERVLASKAA